MTSPVPRRRISVYAILTVMCATIDLWSKDLVFSRFALFQGTDWLLDGWLRFRIHTSLNRGALWGMGQGLAWLFAILSVVALIGIIYWLFVRKAAHSLWLTVALAFVSGGTLGNLYDRLGVHGIQDDKGNTIHAVRDFLHFMLGRLDWAIFNVADICLVTGAIMLMIQSLKQPTEFCTAEA